MDKSKSALVFNDFRVEEMVFKINPLYQEAEQDPRLDCKFNVSYKSNEKFLNQILVRIDCKLFDEQFSEDENPYYLNVAVIGQFTIEENSDGLADGLKDKILKANTVAILFPYVRSIISTLTTTANVPMVVLPQLTHINYWISQKALNLREPKGRNTKLFLPLFL